MTTIFIFKPAASSFFSSFRKLLPQLVYFFLGLAVHEKRYGLSEFELRPTV
jgi:hypothetical protein